MRQTARLFKLTAIDVEADKPLPTEFRIFRAGANASDRGGAPFLFDAAAAKSVIGEYQKQGNRLMMDLAHAATDENAIALRQDATDAMCWYDLEIRNGELWGVNVEWTAEGERRLRAKLQRFISPTFAVDRKTRRIIALDNVALVSRAGLCNAVDLAESLHAIDARPRAKLGASFDAIRTALDGALHELYPNSDGCCSDVWICDVYADRLIFQRDGMLYRMGYTFANGVATLSGPQVRVERQYVDAAPAAAALKAAIVAACKKRITR